MFNSDSKRCQRAPPSSHRFLFCLIILPRSVPFRVIESMGLADFKLRFFFERQLNGCNKLMGLSRSSRVLENPRGLFRIGRDPGAATKPIAGTRFRGRLRPFSLVFRSRPVPNVRRVCSTSRLSVHPIYTCAYKSGTSMSIVYRVT